jgi:hypothetical protein
VGGELVFAAAALGFLFSGFAGDLARVEGGIGLNQSSRWFFCLSGERPEKRGPLFRSATTDSVSGIPFGRGISVRQILP